MSLSVQLSTPRLSIAREGASRILATMTGALLWPVRYYTARGIVAAMAGMSGHELADIGLSRQDLADAAASLRDQEPGAFLARRVRERRRSR